MGAAGVHHYTCTPKCRYKFRLHHANDQKPWWPTWTTTSRIQGTTITTRTTSKQLYQCRQGRWWTMDGDDGRWCLTTSWHYTNNQGRLPCMGDKRTFSTLYRGLTLFLAFCRSHTDIPAIHQGLYTPIRVTTWWVTVLSILCLIFCNMHHLQLTVPFHCQPNLVPRPTILSATKNNGNSHQQQGEEWAFSLWNVVVGVSLERQFVKSSTRYKYQRAVEEDFFHVSINRALISDTTHTSHRRLDAYLS